MDQYSNFTSLPPDEERTFVVYEQRTVESSKKALKLGLIVSLSFFVLVVIIVFSHDKPKNMMEGEDMGMLADEKERAVERKELNKPDPAPAPAAGSDEAKPEGATAPEGGEAAPAEGGEAAPAEGGEAAPAEGGETDEASDDTAE